MSKPYFDQIAGKWDALRASMFGEEVRAAAIQHAALHPEAVALDLGAGTGFLAQGLAPLVSRVHVVDSSAEMLAVARKNLALFENIEYHLAQGTQIPLPDRSVDAVLANMYLHHAPDPQAAIFEMARLLRPGGQLVITDLDEHEHAWLQQEQSDLWLGFPRESLRTWLKTAGLVNVIVADTQQSCCAESQAGGERASVSIFVAAASRPQPAMQAAVQGHYREVAVSGSSCCGPQEQAGAYASDNLASQSVIPLEVIGELNSCCSPGAGPAASSEPGYPSTSCCTSADLQQTEAEISLGCGNPVALASLQPGEFVLDIGSGAGADVFPAAKRVGALGRVIGLDMLPEMLARAQATAEVHGYTNVEFRQGDAQAIPLEDASVDVVMSNCVINLVQDKDSAFREAFRVLKPGGRLTISDIVTDHPFSPTRRSDPASWSACVSGALTEGEYLALVTQAGFQELALSRSQAWPAEDGTLVYSLNLQARKP